MLNQPPEHHPAAGDDLTALAPIADQAPPLFSHGGLSAVDPWRPGDAPAAGGGILPWSAAALIEVLDVVILALAMFMAVRFVAHNYVVDGGSMEPTFLDGDFLIVNRLAYRSFDLSWMPGVDEDEWRPFGTPQPGDIVVFTYDPTASERDFIKRVIAVPGQTVEIRDGHVIVDGVPLEEPYILAPPAYNPMPPEVVEPGNVFVLGDNRNNSFDSHLFGQVDQSQIIGRADFRYWPSGRWGLVDHQVGSGAPEALAGEAHRQRVAAAWP